MGKMKVIITFPSMLHGKAWKTRPGKRLFSANIVYVVSPKRIEYLVHIFSKEKESINAKQNMGTHLESWSPPRCLYISIYTNFSHKNRARHTPDVGPVRRGRRRWEGVETHRNFVRRCFCPKTVFFLTVYRTRRPYFAYRIVIRSCLFTIPSPLFFRVVEH